MNCMGKESSRDVGVRVEDWIKTVRLIENERERGGRVR